MPFRALRNATVALATFDSVAALVACTTKANDDGTKEIAPPGQNAEQAAGQSGSDHGAGSDATADTGR